MSSNRDATATATATNKGQRRTIFRWILMVMISFVGNNNTFRLVNCFPESQNPFSAGPPFDLLDDDDTLHQESSESSCRISLFHNVKLNTYSTVSRFPYYSPNTTTCHQLRHLSNSYGTTTTTATTTTTTTNNNNNRQWDQVILQVKGSVAGIQYDRAGAIWLDGIELLRMTTPEPTQPGISWKVERDVTIYSKLFQKDSEVQVQIPNNVNTVYTGIIYLSAQLVFYNNNNNNNKRIPSKQDLSSSSTMSVTRRTADYITSLSNPLQHNDAWASMAISGNQSMTVNVSTLLFANASRAHIDLYATAHGCEEFWYSNPPDSLSKQYGMCGGGSTRQIQLRINDMVAGSQPPFPVIYTGGINPLLWRPQTGIYSFNVPPYFFDITPFLGILQQQGNDESHHHQISVNILGNNNKGVWNIDPVLVLFHQEEDHHQDANLQRGSSTTTRLDRYEFSQKGPKRTITNSTTILTIDGMQEKVNNVTWVEEYESELIVETTILGGEIAKVSSKTISLITNSLIGETLQVTDVELKGNYSSSSYNRIDQIEYPLKTETDFQQSKDDHSFQIEAIVEQSLHRSLLPFISSSTSEGDEDTILHYEDHIVAYGKYNRSTDPDRTIYVHDGWSHQVTTLFVGDDDPCLVQAIAADDGYVTFFDQSNHSKGSRSCLPPSFCSRLDVCSPIIANASSSWSSSTKIDKQMVPEAHIDPHDDDLFIFRHPRNIMQQQTPWVMVHQEEEEDEESIQLGR